VPAWRFSSSGSSRSSRSIEAKLRQLPRQPSHVGRLGTPAPRRRRRMVHLQTYRNTFTGPQAVAWLTSSVGGAAGSSEEAVDVGGRLIQTGARARAWLLACWAGGAGRALVRGWCLMQLGAACAAWKTAEDSTTPQPPAPRTDPNRADRQPNAAPRTPHPAPRTPLPTPNMRIKPHRRLHEEPGAPRHLHGPRGRGAQVRVERAAPQGRLRGGGDADAQPAEEVSAGCWELGSAWRCARLGRAARSGCLGGFGGRWSLQDYGSRGSRVSDRAAAETLTKNTATAAHTNADAPHTLPPPHPLRTPPTDPLHPLQEGSALDFRRR